MSLIPTSYPGNNLITEDIAEIVENTKCKKCTKEFDYTKDKRFVNVEIDNKMQSISLRNIILKQGDKTKKTQIRWNPQLHWFPG